MVELTAEELACLRRLAGGHAACRPGLLERLQRLGLAERRPLQWLPLESARAEVVITTAGRVLLQRIDQGQ